jgi:LysM repeat protein
MALYPAGMQGGQSSKIRVLMYFGVGIIIAAAALGIYVFLHGRKTEPVKVAEPPAAAETIAEKVPVEAAESESNAAPPAPEEKPATPQAAVTPQRSPDANQLITQAMAILNQPGGQKIIEARDRFNELLPMVQGPQRAFVKEQLASLSEKWLFSKTIFPEDKLCTNYKVSPGDVLANIGKHYNVPYEVLMQINGLDKPESLQAGATIKVINGPFHVRVYRSTFTMDIYLQNTYVKTLPVGLGKQSMETPTGRWRVAAGGKMIKPRWTDPDTGRTYEPEDADYPLGSRWIGLEGVEGAAVGRKGFAIHGTKDPQQIGSQGSRGCIRLHNGDAVQVYNLLMPGVSLVDVVD